MRTGIDRFKWVMMAAIISAGLMGARSASAASCVNDIDCTAHPACGGEVCDYTMGETCQPAGGAAVGSDGWCTVDSDCKCHGMGATCVFPYCTFTKPPTGSGGTGGAAGTTGSAGAGGTTGSAGSHAGTTGSAGAATDGGTTSSGGGGCSVAGAASPSLAGLMMAFGTLVAIRRRRRRA
jgi:MYXO-CTERM domain-containing protein